VQLEFFLDQPIEVHTFANYSRLQMQKGLLVVQNEREYSKLQMQQGLLGVGLSAYCTAQVRIRIHFPAGSAGFNLTKTFLFYYLLI